MKALCHRSSRTIALLLLGLVVYAGLLCSVGHAHMHHAPAQMQAHCDTGGERAMPMDPGVPAQAMAMLGPDCFFSGSLPMALLVFAALGWLLRAHRLRVRPARAAHAPTPRDRRPALNPQAP